MENHYVEWTNPLQMVMFRSYVSHYQRIPGTHLTDSSSDFDHDHDHQGNPNKPGCIVIKSDQGILHGSYIYT